MWRIFTASTKRKSTIKVAKQSRPRENVRRVYGREWYSGYGRFCTGRDNGRYGMTDSRGFCLNRNEKGLWYRGGMEKVRGDFWYQRYVGPVHGRKSDTAQGTYHRVRMSLHTRERSGWDTRYYRKQRFSILSRVNTFAKFQNEIYSNYSIFKCWHMENIDTLCTLIAFVGVIALLMYYDRNYIRRKRRFF